MTTLTHAEIYKTVDVDGRVTYSNVKIKGAQKLNLEPADTSFGTDRTAPAKRASKSETPGNFPKVDASTQKQRDNSRKEVLKSELASEKTALEAAKQAYAEGESNPETYKAANGKTFRNVPKYDEKMKKLQEDIDVHQRNIDLLEKELSSVN
jgi:hypothetical protein